MPTEFKIQRFDDGTIFRVLKAAEEAGNRALEKAKADSSRLQGSGHKITLNFQSGLPWKLVEQDIKNAPAGQFVLQFASVLFELQNSSGNPSGDETATFQIERGGNESPLDSFTLSTGRQIAAMNSDGAQDVLRAIHKELSILLRPVAAEDGGLIPTLSNLAEGFSTTYQRIAAELSDAVAKVSEERTKQINEFNEERERLRLEIVEERRLVLASAQEEIDAERANVGNDRRKLDEERAKLEISSHKDARRRQFMKLQEDLHTSLQSPLASGGLRTARWAVFFSLLLAGGAAGVFAYASITFGDAMSSGSTGAWVLVAIRTSVLTLASLVSFLGAAAWLRYFYVRDLQTQEELQSFSNDMARASWVMDAALEIRKEHQEDIPREWLTGVTKDLFVRRASRDTVEKGSQALAALLGLSASATFGPGGVAVELSKKGRREIAEAARASEGP